MLRRLYQWYRGITPGVLGPNLSSLGSNPFPEEPLTLSGEEGFGFFPTRLGMPLNSSRYKVLRKLGRGQFSSTWLVSDSLAKAQETPEYYAIKILTVHATKCHYDGHLLELEVMQAMNSWIKTYHIPRLYDHFEIDGPHGRHLCLVLRVLSESLSSFRRSAPSKSLAVSKVKIIVAEIAQALVQLHAANIIHTDLKADNVLFVDGTTVEIIKECIDRSPQIIDGEFELEGKRYQIMRSQPIPNIFKWNDPGTEVEYSLCLTDFGSVQWIGKEPSTRNISAYALRAPEIVLGADYGAKVDIWALGCLTFELLTGRWLFHPEAGETWRIEDDHLAKMMELTAETFPEKVLAKCRKRNEYFDESGTLLRIDQLFPTTLERAIMNYGLPEADATSAAAFIRACLHLDPEERSSANDLLDHPWLFRPNYCSR